jgi:hypothetical protein
MLPAFQIKNTRSHQSLMKTVKAFGGTDLAFAHFRPPTAQMAACLRRPRFQAEDACCSTGKQSGAPRSGNWMAPNETVGDPEWGRVTRGEHRPDRWNALFGGRGSCKVPPHARCHPMQGDTPCKVTPSHRVSEHGWNLTVRIAPCGLGFPRP